MPGPPEPPASPEQPDEPVDRPGPGDGHRLDDDAAWRAIIENYGERPRIEDAEPDVPGSPRGLFGPEEPSRQDDEEEHFVPPVPPPVPKPPPARMIAWAGLFGVPLLVLVALVLRVQLPGWVGLFLMCWFVGGFGFLIASMRPDDRNDDDGAVL